MGKSPSRVIVEMFFNCERICTVSFRLCTNKITCTCVYVKHTQKGGLGKTQKVDNTCYFREKRSFVAQKILFFPVLFKFLV